VKIARNSSYDAYIGGILQNLLRLSSFCLLVLIPSSSALAESCSVIHHPPPSEPDNALLAANYTKAADLYRADLAAHPGNVDDIAGLVRALLRQQKLQEAADKVASALATAPGTAALISLRGEVEYRRGMPWAAAQSASEAAKLDLCNPRNHLLMARLARLNSLYATARHEVETAHQLDPDDPASVTRAARAATRHTPIRSALEGLNSTIARCACLIAAAGCRISTG
jgi:tetratricopeptide (TPR) repeat protein